MADEIAAGSNVHDIYCAFGSITINRDDARMRVWTSDERKMQHARQIDVTDIAATATQEPLNVGPRNPLADQSVGSFDYRHRLVPPKPTIIIPRAAA
jgi:hypothetical protein